MIASQGQNGCGSRRNMHLAGPGTIRKLGMDTKSPSAKTEKQLWVCGDSSSAMEGLRLTPLPAHLPQFPEDPWTK